eukprot:scaffold2127_cov85-Cylindrotheca_fusiformis.AAC.7
MDTVGRSGYSTNCPSDSRRCAPTVQKLGDAWSGKGVLFIGEAAFKGCECLTEIDIPSTAIMIGEESNQVNEQRSKAENLWQKWMFHGLKLHFINAKV